MTTETVEASPSADLESPQPAQQDLSGGEAPASTTPALDPLDAPFVPSDLPFADTPARASEPGKAEADSRTPEQQLFAGFSADEARTLLEKAAKFDDLEAAIRRLDGRYGELKSAMATKGEPKQITGESLATIREQFGDEYADALAKDLSSLSLGSGGVPDDLDARVQAALEPMRQEVLSNMKRAMEEELLDSHNPKWRETLMGDELKLWESLQPLAARQKRAEAFQTTRYSQWVKGVLKDFGDWQKARQSHTARKQELASHVPPAGLPPTGREAPSSMSPGQAADRGFAQARGQR